MWSDAESKVDYLNFSENAESIADIVLEPKMLPISIGIFGDWGAGKSTILSLTESTIRTRSEDTIHIKFDAWLYQGYDDARASFLEIISDQILKAVEEDETLFKKAKSFAKGVKKIRALGLLIDGGLGVMGLPTFGAFGRVAASAEGAIGSDLSILEAAHNSQTDIQSAAKSAKDLINSKEEKSPPQIIAEFRKEYAELIEEIDKTIIIYVDNLDRCTPINAINTLEAMRLFVFMPKTAFIVAADEEMIRTAVREYHKGASERHQTDYLDKLIQIPVNVPKPGVLDVRAYLFLLFADDLGVSDQGLKALRETLEESLRNSWKEQPIEIKDLLKVIDSEEAFVKKKVLNSFSIAERMAPILATSSRISGNPRIVKRLLNVVKMRKKVADRRGMNLEESLISKLVIFERCLGKQATVDLYHLIDTENGTPEVFNALENDDIENAKIPESWKGSEKFIAEWAQLEPSLYGVDLKATTYLSRDKIPLGSVSKALSEEGRELLKILLATKNKSGSGTAGKQIRATPKEDYASVMDEIVALLRKQANWNQQPDGLSGALLLANSDTECKSILYSFLSNLPEKRAWLSPLLKELSQ